MMITLAFPRFRASYAIAACSVALAAICAYQAPGLMQAILVVGANAQLPLERLATEASQPATVSASALSSDWHAQPPAEARPAAQKVEQDGRPVRERERRVHHDVHGYERTVTDYRYWT